MEHLNNEMLLTALQLSHIDCKLTPDFVSAVEGKEIKGRIICGESRDEKWFRGITFWVHVGGSGNYIGLWSPRLYRIPIAQDPATLIIALIRQGKIPTGKMPYELPATVIQEYGLVELEVD